MLHIHTPLQVNSQLILCWRSLCLHCKTPKSPTSCLYRSL
nr:MAG TPA: hypothetical protein [Caudoviricetes sp.]